MVSEYRDPDTCDMFGQPPAPEPAHTPLDVSHLSHVSQPSNDAASSRDTTGTPPVPACPIAREVDPGEAEPTKQYEPSGQSEHAVAPDPATNLPAEHCGVQRCPARVALQVGRGPKLAENCDSLAPPSGGGCRGGGAILWRR